MSDGASSLDFVERTRGPELPRLNVVQPPWTSGPRFSAPALAWRTSYSRVLLVGDLVVLLVAMSAAQVGRFGFGSSARAAGPVSLSYSQLGIVLAVVWWLALQVHGTRSPRVMGHGPEEYRRVMVATFRVFALLAMISLVLKLDASRGYLAIALPVGLVGLLVGRKLARVQLHRQRSRGRGLANVLVVGGPRTALQIIDWFGKHPSAGYRVTGVWVPDDPSPDGSWIGSTERRVPVLTASRDLDEALILTEAAAVVVTDTEHLGHETLRELTWQLEGTGIELILSPNVLDVASSRLHLHDVSGMPMLHLDEPQYAGASRFVKSLFDRVGAALLVVVFSPLLLVTAALVKLSGSGPVFYRQTRVGRNGHLFRITKFRSMHADADTVLEELRELNEADGVLFKVRQDPRVTGVGRFLRRYSIDELPQLFDVVRGEMSLVGPRPPLPSEVERYPERMHRRMFVRPGMTGLWQVSGRSDLSFEDAMRLDLSYVDNWSLTGDLMILWRTFRAVLARAGAY
jgi:exopolysaccharide biosynthesis polyprenyl glycosylphosphotransferase